MGVLNTTALDAVARLGAYGSVIDARSEGEFAEDHLPGAINWPSLNNEERKLVGTLYTQVSPFEAQKRGAALVAANIARHIEREVIDKPRQWTPLIYCWRGGKRSNSLALVLGQIGFKVEVLEGGYKAFRGAVLQTLPDLARRLNYRVVCGPTGSGKTRLLEALAEAGAQVLDLEALASHRSSVLGNIPGLPQPGQKHFETLIWNALRGMDPAREVFVESESKKVGNLSVPDALMEVVRNSPCVRLELSHDERVALLMEDYAFFVRDGALLCDRLDALTTLRGKAVVAGWKDKVQAGQMADVVRDLLDVHYDPGYASSTARNFVQFSSGTMLVAEDRSMTCMRRLAQQLVNGPAGVGMAAPPAALAP
jgi:tRNA 2-selenouridine synthase